VAPALGRSSPDRVAGFPSALHPRQRAAIRVAATADPELADWIDRAGFARQIDRDALTSAAELDALVAARVLSRERREELRR
jgi:hypothetical protein